MRFEYKLIGKSRGAPPGLPSIYRPIIRIAVIGPIRREQLDALLDTGCDDTLLPDRLVEPLGVALSGEYEAIHGLDYGAVLLRYGVVDLELHKGKTTYCWAAKVGFHQGDRVILGHSGFLEYFSASFNGQHRRVTLFPNRNLPAPMMNRP